MSLKKKAKKRLKIWLLSAAASFLTSAPGMVLMALAVLVGILIATTAGGQAGTAMAAQASEGAGNVNCTVTTGQPGGENTATTTTATTTETTTASEGTSSTATTTASSTVGGGTYASVDLTDQQMKVASTITTTAETMGLTQRAARIGLAVAYQESRYSPDAANGTHIGIFQQASDPGSGLYTDYDRLDPAGAAHMFFDQLVKRVPDYDTDSRADWQVGEVVQQSGVGENVEQWQPLAQALVDTLWGASSGGSGVFGPVDCDTTGGGANAAFDPGNIISDQVMYDADAMSVEQIQQFIDKENAACKGSWCLRSHVWSLPANAGDQYCQPYSQGLLMTSAQVIHQVAESCGINPQVMLVTLQKESAVLTRTNVSAANYQAAWGVGCPDTGPGGSANCNLGYAGFTSQAFHAAHLWAKYRVEVPKGKYSYHVGTNFILWNVKESNCGGSDVDIKNVATASLYVYTPYQPNAASIAAYPGEGDKCSSYGNRNFFFLFQKYFGDTGGGAPVGVSVNGVQIKLPSNQYVKPPAAGYVVDAPNAGVARGIAAGLAYLGTPYVWGGGGSGSGPTDGCGRGGHEYNACQGIIGFDCSGLTAYVLKQGGFGVIPGSSGTQNEGGQAIPISQALPGDIIHFPGHVAIYLGTTGGQRLILEASTVGVPVHVVPLTRTDYSPMVRRYWH